MNSREVTVYDTAVSDQLFRETIEPRREPAVLRGLQLGPCSAEWADPERFQQKLEPRRVRVHVTTHHDMDFITKNFKYRDMDVRELVARAAADESGGCDGGETNGKNELGAPGEKYYLRSVNADQRGLKISVVDEDYPELAGDFRLPDLFPPARFFSSVLRISSGGIRMWTHYDVMDNVYCQIVGHKTAVLWPPNEALNLYLDGDKSRVVNIDSPGESFPLFCSAVRYTANLQPGDVLFIPAFWFHNMKAHDFGVAVNVFWKELPGSVYDPKDPYGNKDLLPGAKSLRMLDNIIKQLEILPPVYRDFYARQLVNKLEKKTFCSGPAASESNPDK